MINFGMIVEGKPVTGSAMTLPEGATELFTEQEMLDYIQDNQSLEDWCDEACNLVNTNYATYCEQGLSYTKDSVEYTILNNKTTRDEVDKKLANVILNIDTDYDWTMDTPRVKVDFADKTRCEDFMKAVQSVIASNETLLRNKKTDIFCMDLTQVQTYITTPTYPTYERIV